MESQQKKDYLLPGSIIFAALLISGALIYNVGRTNQPIESTNVAGGEKQPAVVEDFKIDAKEVVFLGNENAPITLVEFADYQCPFCAKFFEESLSLIKQEYVDKGKVKIVFQDFAFLGEESFRAAEAAWCAADQGKFWEYHDLIFRTESLDNQENNGNLNLVQLKMLASQLMLDMESFSQCVDSRKYQQKVLSNIQKAKKAGVRATPTVFINNLKLEGALPYEVFKLAIEDELNKK